MGGSVDWQLVVVYVNLAMYAFCFQVQQPVLPATVKALVVGDDGIERLRLGQGDPESEAFAAFQQYVKRLRERGVILAVCSANDEAVAVARTLEEGVRQLNDTAALQAMIGELFMRAYAAVKLDEFEEFNRVISSWEREHLLLQV